jgi:prevent-host-death family protein
MPKHYSIAEARDRFAQIVHEAEQGKPVHITRRNKPVAVVLSLNAYHHLTADRTDFGTSLLAFRQHYQVEALDIDPDQVFGDVRERSAGREVGF